MSKILAGFVVALGFAVGPVQAQTDAEVNARIDTVLGDHTAYRAAFDSLQAATRFLDAQNFAALVSYPITVAVDGEETTIVDEAAFAAQFQSILTPEIGGAIVNQAWQDVFVNDQGVMLGSGEIWLNGICADDSCAAFDVKVIAIQSTSN